MEHSNQNLLPSQASLIMLCSLLSTNSDLHEFTVSTREIGNSHPTADS